MATRPRQIGGDLLGPGPAIIELVAYLGVGVLLGAWIALIGLLAREPYREVTLYGGLTLAAVAMFGLGRTLAGGDRRARRGAGVAFVAVTLLAAGAGEFLVQADFLRNRLQWEAPGVLVALIAVAVAVGLRRALPAVATQFGLLAALTALADATLGWLTQLVHPVWYPGSGYSPTPVYPAADPVGLVLCAGAWWLLVALGIGYLARLEVRSGAGDPAALRRAGVTRLWAGLVAALGLAGALAESGSLGGGAYGRLLEPWIADLALFVLAAVLLWLAARRRSDALLVSAGIAVVLASTDLHFSHMTASTGAHLAVEIGIVGVVGLVGRRLRRRFAQTD